jgi:hypothetical protein
MGKPAGRQPRIIDTLPVALKKRVIDAMMTGVPAREISRMVAAGQPGVTISHVAVTKYRREIVRPAVATAAKIQEIQQSPSESGGMIQEAAKLTQAVIAADPWVSRIRKQQEHLDGAYQLAKEKEDPRGIAAVAAADTRAIELDARLANRLQDHAAPTTQVLIVVPDRSSQQQQPAAVEDLRVIDLGPE